MKNNNNGLHIKCMNFSFSVYEVPFFNNVSAHFPADKITFVKGKNGSGKTTLFRILHGDIDATEKFDAIFELDEASYKMTNKAIDPMYVAHIKHVVQDINTMLADQLTVGQNLQMAKLSGIPSLRSLPALEQFPPILHDLGIRSDASVASLSGGQRQILAIMMILQKPTRVILFDEPTAALDTKNADLVMDAIRDIAHRLNLVVLVISHDKELIERYAQNEYTEIQVADNGVRSLVKKSLS